MSTSFSTAILFRGLNTELFRAVADTLLKLSRSAIHARKSSTSDVGAIGPRVRPNCRHKILARFLKPGLDRKLRLVPTKPCYLSFPASLVDPRNGKLFSEKSSFWSAESCNFAIAAVSRRVIFQFIGDVWYD